MVKHYDIPGVNPPNGRYSQVGEIAQGGQVFYLAGQTAGTPDGSPPAKDMAGQAAQAWSNIAAVLKGCGMTTANIVKTTTYLINPDDIPAWREAQKAALGGVNPASTLLIISRLARPEYLIEVDVVAAKD